MTITYLDSRRIQGLSTDTVQTPTYSTDFSGDNSAWVQTVSGTSNTTYVDSTNDYIRQNTTTNTASEKKVYYDLGSGSVSNTSWVLRFKFNVSTSSVPASYYGLVSGTADVGGGAMDGIVMTTYDVNSTYAYRLGLKESGVNSNNVSNANPDQYVTTTLTGTYYVQIRRLSATSADLKFFSDSSYSTQVGSTVLRTDLTSTVDGLRYFTAGTAIGGDSSRTTDATIDDIKFWNGITSVDSKPKIPIPLTGCKAYYNFEQTTGNLTNIATTANGFPDGLGSSADGTPNNGVTQNATGKVGSYAWSFDGTNDYVGSISSDLGNTWTISFWAKGATASQGVTYWSITGKGASDANEEFNLQAYSTYLDLEWSNGNWNVPLTLVDDGNWHHFVIVFQAGVTNGSTWYIDGVQKNTGTFTAASTKTNQLFLGKDGRSGNYFKGSIDEYSYWTRVLSADEVSKLYNAGSGKSLQGQTNIETNSLFEETDTTGIYWYDGNNWYGAPSSIDKIGIFSGSNAVNTYTANYELYTLSSNTWDSSNTLTTGRSRMSGAADPTNAYIIAGQNGGGYQSIINKINWSTKAETTNTDFSYAPASTGANSDTFCMIMSYYNASYYADSRKVSFSTLTSTAATSISYTGAWATTFGNKNIGFLVNNQNTGGVNKYTTMYTYSTNTITAKTASPTSVQGYGGHAGNKSTGVLYSTSNSDRHTYNINSDTWESSAFTSLPTRKADTAVCSTLYDYYAIGTSSTTVVKINYSNKTLTTLASHGTNRAGGDNSIGASSNNHGVNY